MTQFSTLKPFKLRFPNGATAEAIQVNYPAEVPDALSQIGLSNPQPTLVLVGGASGISEHSMQQLRALFVETLVPLAENMGAFVIDGGTDAGIMQLIGQARAEASATFPLVGVAAIGTVILPNLGRSSPSSDAAPLETNHSHFVLVPGRQWGDESPWIARVADALSQKATSVTLLINGGKIAWIDVTNSVRSHRPVVVMAGSGRTADTLAAMVRGNKPSDEQASVLTRSGFLFISDLETGLNQVHDLIQSFLILP
ncbi:MAG: hypothetical protein KME16_18985 [Scytolyngbya sp. HA4215-MV1]|jgi:hypothetical protein|nr:hypothetical protein [Scytolyngbya sp. HA4215-MV1]